MSDQENELDTPEIETIEPPTNLSADDASSVKGGAGFSGVIEVTAVKFTDIELKSTR